MARDLETDEWEDDSDVLTGSKADAEARAQQAERDSWLNDAYDAGGKGLPEVPGWDDDERAAYHSGRSDALTPALRQEAKSFAGTQARPAQSVPSFPLTAAKSSGAGDGIASFVLGAVLAANLLAWLEYGTAGVKSWWSAKFYNAPTLGTSSGSSGSSGSSTSGKDPGPAALNPSKVYSA